MQRRILLIAIVFVAGFGIGYGITWLFVGSSERAESSQVAGGQPEGRPGADRVAAAPVEPAATPDASAPAGAPEGADVIAGAMAPDAGPAADVAVVAEADAVVPAGAGAEAAPDVVAAAPEVAAAEPAEWERCLNKVCRIDFGGVSGGISVRKGKLEHGQAIEWDRDFGKADKVGTLDSDRNVRVEVLAIGLTDGQPAAAYISRKLKRSTQTGVIALRIGERRLSLVPTTD